jgi:hypothetical protein
MLKSTSMQKSATDITIIFDAETENPIDMQRNGWQAILENFRSYVENTYATTQLG